MRLVVRWLLAALLVVAAFWFAVMGVYFFVGAAARNTGISTLALAIFMLLSFGFAFAAGWFARLRLRELRPAPRPGTGAEDTGVSEAMDATDHAPEVGATDVQAQSGRDPDPPIH